MIYPHFVFKFQLLRHTKSLVINIQLTSTYWRSRQAVEITLFLLFTRPIGSWPHLYALGAGGRRSAVPREQPALWKGRPQGSSVVVVRLGDRQRPLLQISRWPRGGDLNQQPVRSRSLRRPLGHWPQQWHQQQRPQLGCLRFYAMCCFWLRAPLQGGVLRSLWKHLNSCVDKTLQALAKGTVQETPMLIR